MFEDSVLISFIYMFQYILEDFPRAPWLRHHASAAGGSGLITGLGKILHVMWCALPQKNFER